MEDLIDTATDLPVKSTGRSTVPKIIPILVCFLGIFGFFIAGKFAPQAQPDFSSGANIDPAATEEAFLASDSNEDLYALVLALCYQDQQNPSQENTEKLTLYATLMSDRAKERSLDLETIGERSVTEDILLWIQPLLNSQA